jgi:hypothetical protein
MLRRATAHALSGRSCAAAPPASCAAAPFAARRGAAQVLGEPRLERAPREDASEGLDCPYQDPWMMNPNKMLGLRTDTDEIGDGTDLVNSMNPLMSSPAPDGSKRVAYKRKKIYAQEPTAEEKAGSMMGTIARNVVILLVLAYGVLPYSYTAVVGAFPRLDFLKDEPPR